MFPEQTEENETVSSYIVMLSNISFFYCKASQNRVNYYLVLALYNYTVFV